MAERRRCSRRPAISGREGAREVVWELHRARAVFVRAKGEREGGRRGEVHGAECSGELSHNSGERFPGRGSFSRLTEASTRCARRRRSCGRDGGFNGELGRSRERVPARHGARWRGRACAAAVAAAERARAKMRWRRGGGRCSADGGERVEGEAGRGCRAACVAGAWRPRGERVLTPVGALVRASGRRRRGRPG